MSKTAVLLIWIYLSFRPFPLIRIRPEFKFIFSTRMLEISYTLAPVAKNTSITAASRKLYLYWGQIDSVCFYCFRVQFFSVGAVF